MTFSLPPAPQHLARLKALLARIRHFDGLPPEVQEKIAASASPRHFEAGQVIYIEGEPAEAFYLLERGWIKATRMSRDGREQAMLFLQSGEIFGDIAVFSGTTYPGTVVALEDVDVWVIPAQDFLTLTNNPPNWRWQSSSHLSDRVLHYIGLVEDLSLRNVEVPTGKHAFATRRIDGRTIARPAPRTGPRSMKWLCASEQSATC